jgi:molybdopterin-guanine dinucleotide biosynthesis protein A
VNRAAAEPIGCVLAGGFARRLGGAKATVTLARRPLIAYPLDALRWAGLESVVVAKRESPLPALDIPVWHEATETVHPAAGIAEALRRAAGRPVLVLACDMPLVPPGLLLDLAQRRAALAVPRAGERFHPLCARYEQSLLAPLEQAVAAGEALQDVIAGLAPELITEAELEAFGDPETILFNVNTPADLERAERLLAA